MIINGIMKDGEIVRPIIYVEGVGLCVAKDISACYFDFSENLSFGKMNTENAEEFRQIFEFLNSDKDLNAIILLDNNAGGDKYLCLTDIIDGTGYILDTAKNSKSDYTKSISIVDIDDEDSIVDYEYLLDEYPDLFI